MSVDISGTSWDQCRSIVQYSFTSTETIRLVRTDSPGRPPRLSRSSWTMFSEAHPDNCIYIPAQAQSPYWPWHWERRRCGGWWEPGRDCGNWDTSRRPACPAMSSPSASPRSCRCGPWGCDAPAPSSCPRAGGRTPATDGKPSVHDRVCGWNR